MSRLVLLNNDIIIPRRGRCGVVGHAVVSGGATASVPAITWNPSDIYTGLTLSNGNLTIEDTSGTTAFVSGRATKGFSTGKPYWEVLCNVDGADANAPFIGIALASLTLGNRLGANDGGQSTGIGPNGRIWYNAGLINSGKTWTTGDTVGIALDPVGLTVVFYVKGVLAGTQALPSIGPWYPAVTGYNPGDKLTANFGATSFLYSIPSGYVAANLVP